MKKYLAAAAVALASMTMPLTAQAQAWPDRTITFIVPFAAGGGTDAFARPMAAQLDKQFGQRIIVENRAGAGGTAGASAASKAEPNGYTFFIGAAHHAIAPALYPKLDYDFEKDFIPVALIAAPPQVVVVNPQKVQAKTLAEFIAYAKANPNELNYASAGAGTTHHLAGELFKLLSGANVNHVAYRGAGPAMQDLVAGHVHAMFDGLGSSAAQITGGQLRALAIASPQRSPTVPDVPTAKEAGLNGYEVTTWYGVFAPKNTPAPVVDRMRKEIATALASDYIKESWAKAGSPVPAMGHEDFTKFVASEVQRWGKVVKDANVKLN